MKKLIMKKLWDGLRYGCTMFALTLALIDTVFDGRLTVLPHQYARLIAGAVFLGIGFLLSTLIYEEDRLPFFVRTLMHFSLCAVTLVITFLISGGIPDGTGFGTGAVFVLVETGVGLIFWLGNLICFFREARKLKLHFSKNNHKNNS